MQRFFLISLVSILVFGSGNGLAQLMSTLQGGPWSSPSTWQAGVIPTAADDVVLIGPVQLDVGGDYFIHSLTIEPAGKLQTVVSIPWAHMHVTQDVVNHGLVEGKGNLTPLYFTIGGGLINLGQWKTEDVNFADTLQHLLRAEPGSFFNPTEVVADNATLVSDRDLYLYGLVFRAQKLILQRDFATFDTTTVFFRQGTVMKANSIIGQHNAIAGDSSSVISSGVGTFTPTFWDIHIRGETIVETNLTFMNTLTIEDTLRLKDGYISSFTMEIQGDMFNEGYVLLNDQNEPLFFECYGNATNTGYFEAARLKFLGGGIHFLSSSPTGFFSPNEISGIDQTVTSSGDIRLDGVLFDVQTLILQPGHELFTTQNTVLRLDTLEGNHNLVRTTDAVFLDSYYKDGIYRDLIFQGTVLPGTNVTFDGQVTTQGAVRPPDGANYGQLNILGTYTNQGSVGPNNVNSLVYFDVSGAIVSEGDWVSNKIEYMGPGPYTLTLDTNFTFQPTSLVANFSTIVSGSPLRWNKGSFSIQKLELQPGHDLRLNQHAILAVDTLRGNGNQISSDGAYSFAMGYHNFPVLERVTLMDTTQFSTPASFVGPITNYDFMMVDNTVGITRTLTFHGDFHNFGAIVPNASGAQLQFVIEGNLENGGIWDSRQVDLKGTSLQKVAIPDSNNFQATLNILAMRNGQTYQWEKNGQSVANGGHISGVTTPTLSFSKVSPADYGTYRCRIDSSGQILYSREVIIGDVITGLDEESGANDEISEIPQRFELGQNYPNPFNPTTTIPYTLARSTRVRLVLYDALGRQVAVLVDAHQPAGKYEVKLDGRNLAAGPYFYQLRAGEFARMRKLLLIK